MLGSNFKIYTRVATQGACENLEYFRAIDLKIGHNVV